MIAMRGGNARFRQYDLPFAAIFEVIALTTTSCESARPAAAAATAPTTAAPTVSTALSGPHPLPDDPPSNRSPADFDWNAFRAESQRARARVESCPIPVHPGRSSVRFEISSTDGKVRNPRLEYSPFPNTPTAECLLTIVGDMTFRAPFSGPPFTMGMEFLVGADPGTNANFGNFDHEAAQRALGAALNDARTCLSATSARMNIRVSVESSGQTSEVTADPSGPEADCVVEKVRRLRVPPYTGAPVMLQGMLP